MSAGRKVISRPHALFSYSTPKKIQTSESESTDDGGKSTLKKKSDSEILAEKKTSTPIKRQQTVNGTPPLLETNDLRRSRSAHTLERTPTKQANLPPRPNSEVKPKGKVSPRRNKVETTPSEQITRKALRSPSIRIPQQSPRKLHEVDRTPQSPRSLRTPQSPRHLKTRDTRNIPSSLPKPNVSEKKLIRRDFPSSEIVHIKTSVRTIRTLKGESETDGNFITPNSSTPLSHNVKYIRAQFEKNNTKLPPSPSPIKNRVRFNENVQMYPERPSSSPQMTPTEKSSMNSNSDSKSNEVKRILTPTYKTNYDRDCISNGHESSADTFMPKSCLRRSLSDHCLDSMRKKNNECTPPPFRLQNKTKGHVVLDSVTPDCFSPVLLDTCQKSLSCENLTVTAEIEGGETANLMVGVRVRPPSSGEYEAVRVVENSVQIETDQNTLQCFSYDHCFSSVGPQAASQEHVYNTMVKPLVNTAFEGYNVCMFAYGQTGSGKSYSMMGLNDELGDSLPQSAGIIPRFCNDLLIQANNEMYCKITVHISYFEIYNEKIHDLLAPSNMDRKAPLRVREHPKLGPYVVGLTSHKVDSFSGVQDCLYFGDMRRMSAATGMNENSSRSHSIFSITLSQAQTQDEFGDLSPGVRSKVNLVDLAGSERVAQMCASGDRLREGVSINRSLLTLGKVINCLAENRRGFIPYRESLLTWLLKESLGGNSRTVMLATISPGSAYVEESLATLRYACQARSIVNTIHINETAQERSIREMSEELQRLRKQGTKQENGALAGRLNRAEDEIDELKKQLDKMTDDLKEAHGLYTTLQNERDSLVQQTLELNKNSAAMSSKIVSLENINKLLIKEKNDIEKEKVNTEEMHTYLLNENTMLVKERLTLVKEKLRLEQLNSVLEKKITTLEEDKVRVERDKARLIKERRSLEKLKTILEKQNVNLMEEKVEIEKQIAEKENLNLVDKSHLEKEKSVLHEKIRKLEEELLLCKKENLSLKKSLKIEQRKYEQEINRVNSDIESQVQSLFTNFSHIKEQLINYINRRHHTYDDEKEDLRKVNEELKEQLDQQQQTNSFLRKQIEERVNRIQEGYEDVIPDPEQMHEAFVEAQDICTRLQLPYVFHSEPEVTTDTWFPVNVRVYDLQQGTSVRWTQYAFLSWLKSMKDGITSNSRGRILFKDALWLRNGTVGSACSSPCVGMSPSTGLSAKKEQPLRNEVSNVRLQIAALENLRGFNDKKELQTALTSLEKVLESLSSLGVRGHLKCALKFSSTKDNNKT